MKLSFVERWRAANTRAAIPHGQMWTSWTTFLRALRGLTRHLLGKQAFALTHKTKALHVASQRVHTYAHVFTFVQQASWKHDSTISCTIYTRNLQPHMQTGPTPLTHHSLCASHGHATSATAYHWLAHKGWRGTKEHGRFRSLCGWNFAIVCRSWVRGSIDSSFFPCRLSPELCCSLSL